MNEKVKGFLPKLGKLVLIASLSYMSNRLILKLVDYVVDDRND